MNQKKYQKPQIVAKSDAKKSYVAGCPAIREWVNGCNALNSSCNMGKLD